MIRLAHWRILVVCIVSVLFSERNAVAQGAFYQATEQETAGPAGTLIRQEPMPFLGGKAFRILYRSTGMHDEPIAVSGVVVVPLGPPPPGGRPIVAWAHPTTGIAPRCAPSLARFVFQQMQGLRDVVDRGLRRPTILASARRDRILIWSARARRGLCLTRCVPREQYRTPEHPGSSPCGDTPRAAKPHFLPARLQNPMLPN